MSFGVWCLTHKIFSSVNFASGEAAMLLSLSVFVGIIANLGVFFFCLTLLDFMKKLDLTVFIIILFGILPKIDYRLGSNDDG